jgi:class 3 adenylate cyclase
MPARRRRHSLGLHVQSRRIALPIFIDRHDLQGTSAADVARIHLSDLEVQDKYGVKYLTYWFDEKRGTAFCLIDAPDKDAAERVHREAHGHVAHQIMEVDLSVVEAFLGRVTDVPGSDAPLCDPGFRAVMFTDIVGSTEMTARLGDRLAVEIVRAHDSLVRRCLAPRGGREVKHTGDWIMASFGSVQGAVECAKEIQGAIEDYNKNSRYPLAVRVGIHAGEPVEDSRDLFGMTVHLAARICNSAREGEILVSDLVRETVGGRDSFIEGRLLELKGFAEPQRVFSVRISNTSTG